MAYVLHIPGSISRALRWTVNHPSSSYGNGVLVYRNTSDVLDGASFRALRDRAGGWIETDKPERVRSALSLRSDESLGESPEDDAATLALEVREWRELQKITAAQAAAMLGMPKSTYDHIEQGLGFKYPRLLILAIQAFGAPPA